MSAPVPNPSIHEDKEGSSVDVDDPRFNEVYIGDFRGNFTPLELAEFISELGFSLPSPDEISVPYSYSRYGFVKMRSRRDADAILQMDDVVVIKLSNQSEASRRHYGISHSISLGEAINANEGNPTVEGANGANEGAEKATLETNAGEMTNDTLSVYASFKKLAIKEKEDLEEEYCKRTKNIQGQLEALSVKKKAAEEERKAAEEQIKAAQEQVAEARKKGAAAQAVKDAVSITRNELLEEAQRIMTGTSSASGSWTRRPSCYRTKETQLSALGTNQRKLSGT